MFSEMARINRLLYLTRLRLRPTSHVSVDCRLRQQTEIRTMVNMFVTWTAWSGYRSQRTGGPPTEPNVNLSHRVADILQNNVTFQLECIDRMYLNLYVPSLQYEGGVVKFFHGHRGQLIASSALMSPMTKSFVAATERFA